jgi:hemolysin III
MYHGERFNSFTHLAGAALATAGCVALVVSAGAGGDPWKIVGFAIFGAMLVVLYTISALYHSLRGRPKLVLRKLDHCAIYLLIAGTYTPFTLVSLRGAWGCWASSRNSGWRAARAGSRSRCT